MVCGRQPLPRATAAPPPLSLPGLPESGRGVGAGRGRPTRLQPCDRDAEGTAGHVVEPGVVEEVDRLRVAAVLAADSDLQVRAGLAPLVRGDTDESADTEGVEGLERRHGE